MKPREYSIRPVAAPLLFILLLALTIVISEGIGGLKSLFFEISWLIIVPLGILAVVGVRFRTVDLLRALWHSIRLPEPDQAAKDAEILNFAASAAISSGMMVSVIGVILILNDIHDYSGTPRRMALVLMGFFYGFFLSEFVLSPMSCKLAAQKGKI